METKFIMDLPIGDFFSVARLLGDTRHVFLPPFLHARGVEIHMGEQSDGVQQLSVRRLKRFRDIRRRTARHSMDGLEILPFQPRERAMLDQRKSRLFILIQHLLGAMAPPAARQIHVFFNGLPEQATAEDNHRQPYFIHIPYPLDIVI